MKYARELAVLAIVVCGCLPCLAAETAAERAAPENPPLVKLPFSFGGYRMENTPVVFGSRILLVQNHRSNKREEQEKCYLFIEDLTTGAEVARFGTGFSFVSALVNGDEMNVFATVNTNKEWTKDIYRFWSTDLKTWKHEMAIARDGNEHLFNCSVCRDDQGYIMAYESNKPVQWSFRFARSKDLAKWEKVRGIEFSDLAEKSFCACPAIRYFAPYYYVLYCIRAQQGRRLALHVSAARNHVRRDGGPLERPRHLGGQPDEVSDARSGGGRGHQQQRCRPVRVRGEDLRVLRDRRPGHLGHDPRGDVCGSDERNAGELFSRRRADRQVRRPAAEVLISAGSLTLESRYCMMIGGS